MEGAILMGQSKSRGYGPRGWVLIIWIATAFLAYTAIGNYPLNILAVPPFLQIIDMVKSFSYSLH